MSNDFASALIARLEGELEDLFPTWLISYSAAGGWTAELPGWGSLHGKTAAELRERLRKYSGEARG